MELSADIARVAVGGLLTLGLMMLASLALRARASPGPFAIRGPEVALLDSPERRRHDSEWFVSLRWLIAAGTLGLIFCASPEARALLLAWWAALVGANVVFEVLLRSWQHHEAQIVIQALADLALLTGLLNASGGLENPLSMVYVVHVIVGRILVPPAKAAGITLAAIAFFAFMAFGEYFGVLPHYANSFFPHSQGRLVGSFDPAAHEEVAGGGHAARDLSFVLGRTLPFVAVLILIDRFAAGVMRRLRSSESDMRRSVRAAVLDRERLERVVDAAGIGMMQLDSGVSLQWFSGRITHWFGWQRDALQARCPLLEAPGGCATCVSQIAIATGESIVAERGPVAGPEGPRYFRHSASPIFDDRGSALQVVEVIEDTTVRRALEEETVRAGKLSVLGRMAAGIAHEIGNPLASISTRLRVLERRSDPALVAESVRVLGEQIARISRIVQGVSHFGRVRRRDRSAFPINPLVEEMVGILELDPRAEGIRFDRDLEEPSPAVWGVRDQIGQILLNLLLNAVEVSPGGATVRIRTSRSGDDVRLAVEDEGPGIEPAERKHVFDPFYTTKPEGTGLGLAISQGFATAQGGRIDVEDAPAGAGARFVVILPHHDPTRQRSTPGSPGSPLPGDGIGPVG